ncbi:hypothetical protein ITZ04_000784 [Escherichia coli]|nr:hypothetical protein [Escherichia coli]
MSVKRYSVWDDEMFEEKHALNSTNGMVHLMVKHEDYAALEARCLELAAENAGLKDEISNITFMRDDDFFGSTQRAQEVMGRLVNIKTPATDAFLAEVRASELESLAGVAETMLIKFANQGVSDIPESKGWKMIFRQASQRAAQIRKGVQS